MEIVFPNQSFSSFLVALAWIIYILLPCCNILRRNDRVEVGSDGLRALPKVPERAAVRVDLLEKGLLVVNPLF